MWYQNNWKKGARITSKKDCYQLTLKGHAVSSFTAKCKPISCNENRISLYSHFYPLTYHVFITGNHAIITGIYLLVPFSTLYGIAVYEGKKSKIILYQPWPQYSIFEIMSNHFCSIFQVLLLVAGGILDMAVMAIRVVEFSNGGYKIRNVLYPPKNYWILSFRLRAICQKLPKFDFQGQFSLSKFIRIFLSFFMEEYQIRCTSFVIDIFW